MFCLLVLPAGCSLFPYTTLFRSRGVAGPAGRGDGSRGRRTVASPAGRGDGAGRAGRRQDRKSTRLNSSHLGTSYAVFCLKKKNEIAKLFGILDKNHRGVVPYQDA